MTEHSVMSAVLEELIALLALEKIEENLFRGQSQDLGWGTVFGGQVLGQALSAAVQTVPSSRQVHSLHAYFLRPGNVDKPIVYNVDRSRDGSSFTTRRVVAIQSGEQIFNLAASFHGEESGFEHQSPMPEVTPPEQVRTEADRWAKFFERLPNEAKDRATAERPFDIRTAIGGSDPTSNAPSLPERAVWFRANGTLPDDPALHAYLLAYASDYAFLTTSLLPHGVSWTSPGMQLASLDHAIWFHRPVRIDDWVLHVMDSPTARGARGYVRGQVYSRSGELVASTAQEGLIRRRSKR